MSNALPTATLARDAPRTYIQAHLGRGGLGNLLIPWARAEILRLNTQLPMLAPQWVKPHIGPILRHESDLRHYFHTFESTGYVTGPLRWTIPMIAEIVQEQDISRVLSSQLTSNKWRPRILRISRLRDFFNPLIAYRQYLGQRLRELVAPHIQRAVQASSGSFDIGIHIRRGDMQIAAAHEQLAKRTACVGLPINWFINCLLDVRRVLGSEAKARIFSDGAPSQLAPILALPYVSRSNHRTALADMLSMSTSPIFIATGTSTFSDWAAFLGNMPTIWYPATSPGFSSSEIASELEADHDGYLDRSAIECLKAAYSESTAFRTGRIASFALKEL